MSEKVEKALKFIEEHKHDCKPSWWLIGEAASVCDFDLYDLSELMLALREQNGFV